MDMLLSIYGNDWFLSIIKLASIYLCCIGIGKCINTIREGMANAYLEDQK